MVESVIKQMERKKYDVMRRRRRRYGDDDPSQSLLHFLESTDCSEYIG